MRTETAFVGARLVDSYPFSVGGSAEQARALAATGIDGLIGYLGAMTPGRLADVLAAGLAFMPVTCAGEYLDGPADELAQLRGLGLPLACTVWLDLEGRKSYATAPHELIAKIDTWAIAIQEAGYMPGLYIGSPQPLTAEELYALRVVRYWKAPSRVIDRNGRVSDGPACGFCMYQCWDQHLWRDTSVFVDVDFVQKDFRGRLPNWVRA